MNKLLKLWYEKLRPKFIYLIIVLIIISIICDNKSCYINYIFLFICSLFLFVYAHAFGKNASKFNKYKSQIIVLSMIICAVIISSVHNNFSIFVFYFIIVDSIFDNFKLYKRKLILIHFLIYAMATIVKLTVFQKASLVSIFNDMFYMFIFYALILFSFIIVHKNRQERDELKILNCKLIDYSFKERDYLISQERSRISQELHDSLGHLLMALSMNVQYAKALDDKDEIKKELSEVSSLVNESIKTLRSTVYSLRKLDEDFNLHEELKSLITKFNALEMVKINLDYDNEIENSSGTVKNVLLITIKEAITNSLKHGNASVINISLEIRDDRILLEICDNGLGCKAIVKSNGLSGISDRFEKINGKVSFNSRENNGFSIKGEILND